MRSISSTLDRFCDISGQVVSMEKTNVLFSRNVDRSLRTTLFQQSGFRGTTFSGKYLGVSLTGRAPRRHDFQHLVDKVRAQLSGWKSSHLSFVGRVALSKSVIQAILVYSMITTPIPKGCLRDIQTLQRQFVWGDTENKRRVHMVKWDTMTLPKHLGGLGVRNLLRMNEACLMKLGWAFRAGGDSLWCQVLHGKYGAAIANVGVVSSRPLDSFVWKGIARTWPTLDKFKPGPWGMVKR